MAKQSPKTNPSPATRDEYQAEIHRLIRKAEDDLTSEECITLFRSVEHEVMVLADDYEERLEELEEGPNGDDDA